MVNVGINDGDYLIVQESQEASNGEIVVALVNYGYESGATVKRFFRESDNIRLQPENDYMDPIIARDVTVVGKVKGVFRYFN
jgi:repressor LexA